MEELASRWMEWLSAGQSAAGLALLFFASMADRPLAVIVCRVHVLLL